ncbi:MAG TPA: outer membrane protein transport protein [Gemmatimonadales bacterium]|jgi:long-chain fatty acid transport protein
MRGFLLRSAVGLTAAALLFFHAAAAQGFGVYEQGACVMGRAGTGAAKPCADGSSIYFNPANIANTPDVLSLGGTLIAPRGTFTNDLTGLQSKLDDKYRPVPNFYLVKGINLAGSVNRVALGLGLFVPYGLTTEWPDTSEARFLGYRSDIRAIYLQPTVAIQISHRFSVGAGLDVDLAHVQLRQRVDLSSQLAAPGVTFGALGIATGTDFADANLDGNATKLGFHVGLSAKVTDWLDIGARYMSRQSVSFNNASVTITQIPTNLVVPADLPGVPAGTPVDALVASQFTGAGPLTNQTASTVIHLPDQAVFGVAVRPVPRLTVLGDVQYTHWQYFDSVAISFEKLPSEVLHQDNHDVWDFRLGGEFEASPSLTLRGGWYIHNGASPDYAVTPNLPEGDRSSFSVGIGTRLARGFRLDAAYQYINQGDRRGRSVPLVGYPAGCNIASGTACTALSDQNNGLYSFHAHLVGATFSYAF